MTQFQWAAGTAIGTEHQRLNKNNQDAFLVREMDDYLVGVVADGCGSCPQSEVGAWLGVELAVQGISERLPDVLDEDFFRNLRQTIINGLPRVLAPQKYSLFTLLGFVITPTETVIFSCGDGVMAVNGELTIWEFENNAPPYLIYPDEMIKIISRFDTQNLQSLLISTDGLEYWLKQREVSEFWEDSRYFKNPDQVRRTLAIANRKSSLLKDDTTLIVVRKLIPELGE